MRAQLLLSLITSAIFFQTLAFTVDKSVLKCETDGTTKQFARVTDTNRIFIIINFHRAILL